MRKLLFAALLLITASSCQESIEDRAAREAREYTEKNCPMQVSEGVTTDSMAFDTDSKTLHYYYSLSGRIDTTAFTQLNVRDDMLKTLRGTPALKRYREAGFNFKYTFSSTKNRGKVIQEFTITANDLAEGEKK